MRLRAPFLHTLCVCCGLSLIAFNKILTSDAKCPYGGGGEDDEKISPYEYDKMCLRQNVHTAKCPTVTYPDAKISSDEF